MVWGKFSRKHYSTDEKLINEKSSIKVYTIGIKPQNSRSFTVIESLLLSLLTMKKEKNSNSNRFNILYKKLLN